MSVFTESATYHSTIFKLDVSTPVKGGNVAGPLTNPTDGHSNAPLQGLVDRTAWLKSKLSPIGEILNWPSEVAPGTDYLLCNGASLDTTLYADLFAVLGYSYGGSGSNFNVPDLRGQFLRGWNNASGTDPNAATRTAMATGGATGDNVGSVQADELKSHNHQVITDGGAGGGQVALDTTYQSNRIPDQADATAYGSGSETRPKNAYVNFVIRATIT